jgi:ATPase subunit of ABC transporter with duplicated ATPase domains
VSHPRGVLAARNISKSYGDVVVLDQLSLTVTAGSRIGVVGPNGIGKSTLLRVLAGLEPADAGVVRREPADLAVATLAQESLEAGRSPGEAARIRLEALIAAAADVALLDEPTNDLDVAGLELLDRFVDAHRGGMVVVSHDRAFLERMTRIVEFEAETRRVRTYSGGWSEFASERARTRERQQQAYVHYATERERVEEQARQMRRWQERGYGQGRKKKKGKDLAKAVEKRRSRIERVEKPWSAWQLELKLAPQRRGGDIVARLEQAVVERDRFRLGPLDLELRNGERLAILGPNGSGKTTLLRALLGEVPLRSGVRWVGPSTVLGTLPQGLGPFSGPRPLIDAFVAEAERPPQDARSLLAKFGLGPDHVRRPGHSLSPGERSRATLALLSARGVNTLVLDEPTNNLDLEAIEQLEAALETFDGTVVLVTHDRRFLEAFAVGRTLEIEAGGRLL